MTREIMCVALADLHAGSSVAPGVEYTDSDGRRHIPSLTQTRLNTFLEQALADTKAAAKGCDIVLLAGGDLIDGDRHHGTHQTFGTIEEQVGWAVQMLGPWADIAVAGYGLKGTEAHVGKNGVSDLSVCERLGLPVSQFWRERIGGKVLDWAHHTSGSRKPWLASNAPVALANKTYYEYLEEGEERPSLILRHHMHYPIHVMAKGIQVIVAPGWQAQTDYSYSLDPNGLMRVGVVWWWPGRDVAQVKTYKWPARPIGELRLDAKVTKRKASAAAN